MRCVYGHPYEQEPKPEQVIHAAAMVVEHLLAEPVRLRCGYGNTLLNSLLQNKNFLDDQESTVGTFVAEVVPRIDKHIYGRLLEKYWKDLEKIADDRSMEVFSGAASTSRGHSSPMSARCFQPMNGMSKSEPTKILARVFELKALFQMIGKEGGFARRLRLGSGRRPFQRLHYLERLMDEGA